MAKKGTPHSGILYRSPTGDLYFMRDNQRKPRKLDPELRERVQMAAMKVGSKQFVTYHLPKSILDDLEHLFGPLIGAWWIWGP
jgi:hypothetical protein